MYFVETGKSKESWHCANKQNIIELTKSSSLRSQGIVTAILNRSIWKVIPLLKAYKAVEEYYPEIASTIVLFNVPKVATFFYKVVRSFLDPVTAAKISLYSTAEYDEVFSSLMPLNAIPEEYGGTSKVTYPETATE